MKAPPFPLQGFQNAGTYYYIDSVVVRQTSGIILGLLPSVQLCKGYQISVPYTLVSQYASNNVFTLQLSDASGGFGNPVNIGTLASNTDGIITGNIPLSATQGTGYRVRIISSSYPDTSLPNSYNISIGTTIPPKPSASANTPLCTRSGNLNLSATNTMSGIAWQWTGPGGYNSFLQNPSIPNPTAAMSGQYIVAAFNLGCKSEPDTIAVVINIKPDDISANSNTPLCEGASLNLTSTNSSPGVVWGWTGPGGYNATTQNPIRPNITPAMSGDYIVSASANGCTAKDTVTVLISPMPTVSINGSGLLCEGGTLSLLAVCTQPSASYSWTGPLGFSGTIPLAGITNVTPAMSGNYVITTTLNNCVQTATMPVVVGVQPTLPVAASNSPACGTLSLTAASSPAASYVWSGPAGFSSTQQNPAITPATPANSGTYNVTANIAHCSAGPVSIQAVVNPLPYLGAYASPNDTVCDGTVVTFVTVPMNGVVNPQFQWFKNGVAVPGQTALTYIGAYTTGDKFYCRTYAQDLCNNNITLYSNEIAMVVQPIVNNLAATISSTPAIPQPGQAIDFMCTVVSGGYTPQYQWRKNGMDVNGAISANWSANNLAPYDEITCHVTSSDPCAAPTQTLSNKVIINFPTVVTDVNADNGIRIYPNPNSGNFTIESKKHIERVEVLNSIGQKVHTVKVGSNSINISLPATLANGVYTLSISTEDGTTQQRITLQR